MFKLLSIFIISLILFTPTLANNLVIKDLTIGQGKNINRYDQVTLHYTGWLNNGVQFDSSYPRQAITLTRNTGEMMPGWEEGLNGMRVGGKRKLIIPPNLAFGRQGVPGIIPQNATVKFHIEVISATSAPFETISPNQLIALKQKGAKLIDIRRPDEWQRTGVIQGSLLNSAFDQHDRFILKFNEILELHLDKNEPIILICRSGVRTGLIARALIEQAGYKQVYNLENGINNWIDRNGKIYRNCLFESGSYC